MTYYGRLWNVHQKYEEAARQGAAAAIILHETKPAAYPWQVVKSSNGAAKLWLEASDKNRSVNLRDPKLGSLLDTAKDLFSRAGLDYLKLKAAANQRGFKAVPMSERES